MSSLWATSATSYARLEGRASGLCRRVPARFPLSYGRRHREPPAGAEPAPRPYKRRVPAVDTTEVKGGRKQTLRKPRAAQLRAVRAHVNTTPSGNVPPEPLIAVVVLHLWYNCGMARVRISTTVDEQLLATARRTRSELADAALIDEALSALLARHRAGEIEAAYAAYDHAPLDADDEWGNLATFRTAAGAS